MGKAMNSRGKMSHSTRARAKAKKAEAASK